MNSQIRKLYNQAVQYTMDNAGRRGQASANKMCANKFAELIVKECADFLDYRLTNPDGASMAWCDGSDIKEHFLG